MWVHYERYLDDYADMTSSPDPKHMKFFIEQGFVISSYSEDRYYPLGFGQFCFLVSDKKLHRAIILERRYWKLKRAWRPVKADGTWVWMKKVWSKKGKHKKA